MKKLFFFTGVLAMLMCAFLSTSCSQVGGELPTLSTDAPAEINFDADGTGGMPSIEITTNQASWAHSLNPADGGGWLGATATGDILVLTAQPNELAQERTPVTIRITAGDAVPVEITVKQGAPDPVFSVTPALDGIIFNADGTTADETEFTVHSNLPDGWAVAMDPADGGGWLSITDKTVTGFTLSYTGSGNIGTERSVSVGITSGTNRHDIEVKQAAGVESTFILDGIGSGSEVVVTFTDGSTQTFDYSVGSSVIINSGRVIYSLTIDGIGTPVLIGRNGGETIKLKFDAGALAFRDAVDGNIPIGSYAEFALIGTAAGALTGSYIQEAHLDLLGAEALTDISGLTRQNWKPIGTSAAALHGSYNGKGFTVANLYVNRPEGKRVGLFGCVGTGGSLTGIGIVSGSVKGNERVGGVCGENYEGTVSACYNTSSVTGTFDVGGVVGYSSGNSAYLIACYNIGAVSGSSSVGGVCGYNMAYMKTCYWLKRGTEVGANYSPGGAWAFGESSWPDTTMQGWGTGDGSADNTYWKPLTPDPLGKWVAGGTPNGINSVFPKLCSEK